MIEVVLKLDIEQQNQLINLCRNIISDAPLFQKTMPNGAKFKYLCTSAGQYGWLSDRKGYRYEEQHPVTKTNFPPMPKMISDIAIQAAEFADESIIPESALINWYAEDGKLGLHVDKTENCDAPVVSISLGDDCVFTIGGLKRTDKKRDVILNSGDVLVMSGEHRYCYHGVKKIIPNTAPKLLDVNSGGRINITIRQVDPIEKM